MRGQEAMYSAALSPDGKRIVTASFDTPVARIWDAGSTSEIAVLRGHENDVYSAVFSPDGTRIVTASLDGTARIWDAASGKEIAIVRVTRGILLDELLRMEERHGARMIDEAREGSKWSAAFNPDGTRIVTGSDDSARIWDVHLTTMSMKDLVTEVCTRRLRGLTKLNRDEMRLAGYPDVTVEIDVCAGIE